MSGRLRLLPRNQILLGDAVEQLRRMPDGSVDCAVTSPPYYRLRNYGEVGQLGLEESVSDYVDRLVKVCEEVARTLKPTGSLWLNLGDSFSRHVRHGAPAKSLVMAPERVALALIERGWILRNKVIWAKPNPMPTSVKDRLTCSYEVIYCFARSSRVFYDLDAIRVPHKTKPQGLTAPRRSATTRVGSGTGKYDSPDRSWAGPLAGKNDGLARARRDGRTGHPLGKNPGDVWTIPTGGYRGAHFATFPERLVTRPLLATCPVRTCRRCGAPWRQHAGRPVDPSCTCQTRRHTPGIVLDPFMGAGTTAVAAARLGRDWIGTELNAEYRTLALNRIATTVVRPSAHQHGGDAQPSGADHAPEQSPPVAA